ncbi:MAG: hypothetical protein LBP69_02405 [Treponema sp.]|jgi:hypothetical protein|nr:hypothetical protein [Treponema sp.]
MKKRCAVFFAFLVLSGAFGEDAPEIPSEAQLKRLLNKPAAVYTKVDSYKEEEKVWIAMEADVHVCTDIPLSKLKAAVTDYDNYVNIFKRTSASAASAAGGADIVLSMQLVVGALGITFVTNYSVLMTEEIDGPDRFLLRFSHYSDDGTVKNVRGYWYFKTVSVDGKPCTYIRYFSASDSIKKNVLQKTAVSMFIVSEYTGMLRELLAAAVGGKTRSGP